eukprot:1156802-Pelagomonas_calceolata.AAC.6
MLMKTVLTGADPGAWLGATGQLLSAAKHNNAPCSSAHCTRSHQNLKSTINFWAGPACQVPGWMVGWLAGSGQVLPSKTFQRISTAPATASHAPLTLQGCQAKLPGGFPKFQGGVVLAGPGQPGVNFTGSHQT